MTSSAKTLLKVLVQQRQWRYADFVRAYERTAGQVFKGSSKPGTRNLTVSEPQFRRWTAGKVTTLPSTEACQVLERLFGIDAATLFGPPPTGAVGRSSKAPTPYDLESEIAMTARDAADEASTAAAQSLSDTTLDQLRDDVTSLARRYTSLAPFDVFRDAKLLREQAEHLRDRTQVPAQRQDLLIIAGQACALLSTAAFDLGSLDGAVRLARSAALYGETARFDALRAYAGGSLAICAYFAGRPSDAVRLVRTAQSLGGLGDIARRRLLAIEARAYGHLGDHARAERTLRASVNEHADLRDDLHDDTAGEFGFTEERLLMSNGTTCLLLQDGAGAETAAQRALTLISSRPPARQSASVRGKAAADLATAQLLRQDLDGAAATLETVWAVPREKRVAGLLERTGNLRATLTATAFRGSQLAAELGERIEDFGRLSAPHQLGTSGWQPALEA
ncbi:DNA-binding protein [Streptomyces lunaelactis]|uniref:DNA-binding protein n=1 Tax=Streptomyces lunaelactis TaxID=1535768 RepID=UPI00158559BD|nr:DNA-binding protein [Streptomyces lunaelactis]NUK13994.1 DNA-binding protein [Streptomyces lunaelactis]